MYQQPISMYTYKYFNYVVYTRSIGVEGGQEKHTAHGEKATGAVVKRRDMR